MWELKPKEPAPVETHAKDAPLFYWLSPLIFDSAFYI